MKKYSLLFLIFISYQPNSNAAISDLFDPVLLSTSINQQIDRLNLSCSTGFPEGSLIKGLPIGIQFDYEVGPSYKPKNYNRIDKYEIPINLNIGTIAKELSEMPLSFSITRNQSFFFVRQFQQKKDAITALPYSPNRLPINANRALEKLKIGDFASIPANLNLAISANASTGYVNPVPISASVNLYWVINGEFNIQIYKLDEKHVRLKMITTKTYNKGASTNTEASFNFFEFNALNHQIDRLLDRDLIQLGTTAGPGSQFILDYIFDLTNPQAAMAYNQILGSSFKFKDLLVLKNFSNNQEIKDKLYTIYELADQICLADNKLPIEQQRIRRLFKGFTNSTSKTKHLKLGFFLLSYINDKIFSKNNITFIDDRENETEFFYPTYTHFKHSMIGNWLFGYEDVEALTFFGLIPKFNTVEAPSIPEIGLNLDQTDAVLTSGEQIKVKNKLKNQLPPIIAKKINWNDWISNENKHSSRISLKIILKSEAYSYLKDYSEEDINRLLDSFSRTKKIKTFHMRNSIQKISEILYTIFQSSKNNYESSLQSLVDLNKYNVFQDLGIGFLVSLLPQEKLEDLIYTKLEMIALDEKSIEIEYGRINFQLLYRELAEVQSKIANRSYDLRVPNPIQP